MEKSRNCLYGKWTYTVCREERTRSGAQKNVLSLRASPMFCYCYGCKYRRYYAENQTESPQPIRVSTEYRIRFRVLGNSEEIFLCAQR